MSKRTKKKFAWRPQKIGSYMVWLEFYEVKEVFYEVTGKWHTENINLPVRH
jgi:hypothetical protein